MKLAGLTGNALGIPLTGGYVDLSEAETGGLVSAGTSLVKGLVTLGAIGIGAALLYSIFRGSSGGGHRHKEIPSGPVHGSYWSSPGTTCELMSVRRLGIGQMALAELSTGNFIGTCLDDSITTVFQDGRELIVPLDRILRVNHHDYYSNFEFLYDVLFVDGTVRSLVKIREQYLRYLTVAGVQLAYFHDIEGIYSSVRINNLVGLSHDQFKDLARLLSSAYDANRGQILPLLGERRVREIFGAFPFRQTPKALPLKPRRRPLFAAADQMGSLGKFTIYVHDRSSKVWLGRRAKSFGWREAEPLPCGVVQFRNTNFASEAVSIGNRVDAQIRLPNQELLRYGLLSQASPESGLLLTVLNGTNLLKNGRPVAGKIRLHQGDRLRIGTYEFRWEPPVVTRLLLAANNNG